MGILTNFVSNVITDVKGIVKETGSAIVEVGAGVIDETKRVNAVIGLDTFKPLTSIIDFNERIIDSLGTRLDLSDLAALEKQRLQPISSEFGGQERPIDYSHDVVQKTSNVGSSSTLADITKIYYKELYEIYNVTDSNIRNNWKEIQFVDELKTGLDARVFVNTQTHEINFAFEGSHGFTKLLAENVVMGELLKDLSALSDNFTRHATDEEFQTIYKKWGAVLGQDGYADLQIFANKIPDQFYTAYAWFKSMQSQLSVGAYADYKQVITGHSLAGAMAQMVSAQYTLDTGNKIPTLAFEGPGMLSQMQQLAGKELKPSDFSHIVNFVTEDDLVGEFFMGNQVGLTVAMPYTMSRNDEFWALKYRWALNAFQEVAQFTDIRIDRHEMGQQIDVFNGTDFTYPENQVVLTDSADFYQGTSGKEELVMGFDGNDILFGGTANDYICGGEGEDYISGGFGNDFLVGDQGNDRIFGDAGKDLLYGGLGDDYLDGGLGDDRLYGGKGNDTLVWSAGNDLLYGQTGDDKFILGKVNNSEKTSGNVTVKFDREASGNDRVSFDLTALDTKNSYITFLMSDHIIPSDVTMVQDGKNLVISYDTNSSIMVENWSEVNKVMGSHVTVSFGSEINCAISGTGLVKK